MTGRAPQDRNHPENGSTRFDAEAATFTLAEAQRLAAEKRAIAETVLAQARDFEQQLATESDSVTSLVATAAQAQTSEAEAAALATASREKHAALAAAEQNARADAESAERILHERQAARAQADAQLAQLRGRIEMLSGTNGLSAEALKRIVERRIADMIRQNAEQTAR